MKKALVKSMRLRTLPLSLAGVLCGGMLAVASRGGSWWVLALTALTACLLQVLSNLSNEMGDHLSGVDGEGREGPTYSLAAGGLTERQLWQAINASVVACAVSGLAMLLVSFRLDVLNWQFLLMVLLGAAAIWAATHYTLGKNPYGYRGLGDVFVFLFFGLVSVLGSYFVVARRIDFEWWLVAPATGVGLLSVAVLNVNNIRDMESDAGKRQTVPLRIGERRAKLYQTLLVVVGTAAMCAGSYRWWFSFAVGGIAVHLWLVWRGRGRALDPALPVLVVSTFLLAVFYALAFLWLTISTR